LGIARGKDYPYFIAMLVKLREIPGRIYFRYTLLSIPALVLVIAGLILAQRWITIPLWLSATIVSLWIIKDAILFPYVWRAYDWDRPTGSRSMVGKRGIARQRLAPIGYVLVQGELWKAECLEANQSIESGKFVRIVKMDGLKLYVEAEKTESQ
jgi:membrane protein implicated in regulation of membrane protease activity